MPKSNEIKLSTEEIAGVNTVAYTMLINALRVQENKEGTDYADDQLT